LPVAAGRVHRKFVASNGKHATLHAARCEDLDPMTRFANALVKEQHTESRFGTLVDGPVTREERAKWLRTSSWRWRSAGRQERRYDHHGAKPLTRLPGRPRARHDIV